MILRILAIATCVLACRALAQALGMPAAIGTWSASIAVICVIVGLLLARTRVGEVGMVNRIAGPVLFPGFPFAQGKLPRMVVFAWLGWTAIGALAVFAAGTPRSLPPAAPSPDGPPGPITWSLLVLSWLLLGFALLRTAMTLRWRPPPPKSARMVLLFAVLLFGTIALAVTGRHRLALTIAGLPPAIVLGGYGLILLVTILGGKKMRWN